MNVRHAPCSLQEKMRFYDMAHLKSFVWDPLNKHILCQMNQIGTKKWSFWHILHEYRQVVMSEKTHFLQH